MNLRTIDNAWVIIGTFPQFDLSGNSVNVFINFCTCIILIWFINLGWMFKSLNHLNRISWMAKRSENVEQSFQFPRSDISGNHTDRRKKSQSRRREHSQIPVHLLPIRRETSVRFDGCGQSHRRSHSGQISMEGQNERLRYWSRCQYWFE